MKKIILNMFLLLTVIESKNIDFSFQGSYGFGGDKIISGVNNLYAGGGLEYSLGLIFNPLSSIENIDTTFTVGFNFNGILFLDDYYITKVPITLVESYTYARHWKFGTGITYHTMHKGHKDKINTTNIKFDNALGGVFIVGYLFGRDREQYLALKVTMIEYNEDTHFSNVIDGNTISFMMETRF